MDATSERLKAAQRLASYPERLERLKKLWISLEDKPVPVRYAGATSRRSPSPSRPRDRSPSLAASRDEASPSLASRREASVPKRSAAPKRAPAAAAPKRRSRSGACGRTRSALPQGPLTARQIQELMSRDLTPEDYELLLLLDEGVVKKAKVLSSEQASALPRARGTSWVDEACPICLCALEEDEDVRMLPSCGHHFHAPCAIQWLTSTKATCPMCGREESTQEKIINLFRRFDENGDGLLEQESMRKVLERIDAGFWDPARVGRFFEAADVGADGKLDTSEFINWLFVDGVGPELTRSITREEFFRVSQC
eukprot:TRINITY_DN89437_c0_g1_i1.p1 TRINITY_DN89437_c0_g1~~TRINITY_DN89437_c0_g1_i1.p1  ORF type:complete len:318 (+),score=55.68 TRINITY_DN89437_c0_g1_i1:23-955(+)